MNLPGYLSMCFGINEDGPAFGAVNYIFNTATTYCAEQIEQIYQDRIQKMEGTDTNHLGVVLHGKKIYRPFNMLTSMVSNGQMLFITETTEEEDKAYKFREKVCKDIKFVQQWFSILVNLDEDSGKYIPPALMKNYYEPAQSYTYTYPPGKESLWRKAEEIINYYLGLRLVLCT